ncbi:MAG: zinc-dependent peptidase [Bacteroidota bacterium]
MGFFSALFLGIFILWAVSKLTLIAPQYLRKSLTEPQKACLRRYSRYYQKLLPTQQLEFEQRVAGFIAAKTFIPREFARVTDEMKVLIASTAVQLTFGLHSVGIRHFRYIIIYPREFFSIENNQYHKGEVNPAKKAIVLSWENFVETMATDDGRNLGLHEMAHALELENMIRNGEQDFFDRDVLHKWSVEVNQEIERIRKGITTFFRAYAGTDRHEFFASAVEVFFEQPYELREYNRRLYYLLAVLLNQNPILLNRQPV